MAGFETTFQTLPSGYRQQLPGLFCHDLDRRLKVPRLVPIKKTEQAPKSTQPFFDKWLRDSTAADEGLVMGRWEWSYIERGNGWPASAAVCCLATMTATTSSWK
jgi:hypothetical protein